MFSMIDSSKSSRMTYQELALTNCVFPNLLCVSLILAFKYYMLHVTDCVLSIASGDTLSLTSLQCMTPTLQLDRRIKQTFTSWLLLCTALIMRRCFCNFKKDCMSLQSQCRHSSTRLHFRQWQIAATELGFMLYMLNLNTIYSQR